MNYSTAMYYQKYIGTMTEANVLLEWGHNLQANNVDSYGSWFILVPVSVESYSRMIRAC